MSIVRYTNKETGVVTIYESTSHYDPVTKQSRPIRKYLGREDPVTGELIPSSGQRGRKKGYRVVSKEDAQSINAQLSEENKKYYEEQIRQRDETIRLQSMTIRKLESEKESAVKKLSLLLNDLIN